MTPQASQPDTNLQAELDRLTYSAYLLTLDPGKAFSAVQRAIDGSLEDTTVNSDLLERTVELALEDLRLCESRTSWDGESSAYDVALYGSQAINSKAFQPLFDLNGSPSFCSIRFPASPSFYITCWDTRLLMLPRRHG
jgi:hypothetical protein